MKLSQFTIGQISAYIFSFGAMYMSYHEYVVGSILMTIGILITIFHKELK